jgi:hypothetical protein
MHVENYQRRSLAPSVRQRKNIMKTIILFIFLILIPICLVQKSNSASKEYTGPFEFIVEPTYSGLDEIGINLDSCIVTFNANLKIVTIRGILVDRSILGRIPFASVAIGIDSMISKVGSKNHFAVIDTARTDSLGRFNISSKVMDQQNATFTFSFPGYFRYYIKLKKIILLLNKQ